MLAEPIGALKVEPAKIRSLQQRRTGLHMVVGRDNEMSKRLS